MSLLHLILLIPIAAAAAILLRAPARATALGASALNAILALVALVGYNRTLGGYQWKASFPVLPEYGLYFSVGVDGLSLWMVLLSAWVCLAAVAVSPKVGRMEGTYWASVLLVAAGAIGAFVSTDLFFFYAFHELALVPTFLLIGIWGWGDKRAAAWKITLYLAFGSMVLLAGLVLLYLTPEASARTFDMEKLAELAAAGKLNSENDLRVFLLLLVGFGILVSLFPFHSWAPGAYASAPVPAAMLHAGVLKKFGLYGLMRLAFPLFPEAALFWQDLLLVLLACNILYIGWATMAQTRLDWMIGYSSVMHMGYIFLGLASGNAIGYAGAAMLMVAHGLSVAALFALAGRLREVTGTLSFDELGGLARRMPGVSLLFGMVAFASIGLPGFANFAAELMVFFGAFKGDGMGAAFTPLQIAAACGLWGLVISAVYTLRAYRVVFFGETPSRWAGVSDLSLGARAPVILLVGMLLAVGFCPHLVLRYLQPVAQSLLTLY